MEDVSVSSAKEGVIFPIKEEYTLNAINSFPIKEKYFPDPVIFLERSLGCSTQRTKGEQFFYHQLTYRENGKASPEMFLTISLPLYPLRLLSLPPAVLLHPLDINSLVVGGKSTIVAETRK